VNNNNNNTYSVAVPVERMDKMVNNNKFYVILILLRKTLDSECCLKFSRKG
jgi:hypothetical protein